jgi:hypothetical protein
MDPATNVRRWIQNGHTGCSFARALTRDEKPDKPARITVVSYHAAPLNVERLNQLFDQCAANGEPAIVAFPDIRSVPQLVALLGRLGEDERWECTLTTVEGFDRDDDLVRVIWQAPHQGWRSEVMGLAPLLSMPVTRRAPYPGLALWPGAPSANRLFARDPDKPDILDLLDTTHAFAPEAVGSMKKESIEATKAMTADPSDKVGFYRSVAFVLPAGSFPR